MLIRAYVSFNELYRIHLIGSFFVVRAKTNLKYTMVKWKRRMPKNILADAEVKLAGYFSEKKYPKSLPLIRYYDEENDREFTFLTNATHISALDFASFYMKRWVKHDMQLKCSTYEVLQILSISLTDKTHLRDLFDKTNFNDIKELDCPLLKDYLIIFLTRLFLLDTIVLFY